MLSFVSYGWKCVLGTELVYTACLFYGKRLSLEAQQLHRSLFELLPGFSWEQPSSMVLTGVYLAFMAAVFSLYIVWMHNSSILNNKTA